MGQVLAFKMALDPTQKQSEALSSHVGAVRFAYNWAVAYVESNWNAVKEGVETEYVNATPYGLLKALNAVKADIAPWYVENSKEAFATGTRNAGKAFRRWFDARKKGQKVGFPKFKTRHHDTGTACGFTTDTRRLEDDNRHLTLPRIGTVRLHERQKTLRWLLSQGGRMTTVTVKKHGARWFASVLVNVADDLALRYFEGKYKSDIRRAKSGKSSVGIDLGLKVFLTASDGTVVENPAFLKASLTNLRKDIKRQTRRRHANKKTGEAASKRWDKAHQQLIKTHDKIRNQREDFLHKTSHHLVSNHELIATEDLYVAGMAKNRNLARAMSDVSWSAFTTQLGYKAPRARCEVRKIDRFYPSSKTCSDCGAVKAKLPLSVRTYRCSVCGMILDRDLNAARNIINVAQSCGETKNGRGDGSSGPARVLDETAVSEASSQPVLTIG